MHDRIKQHLRQDWMIEEFIKQYNIDACKQSRHASNQFKPGKSNNIRIYIP